MAGARIGWLGGSFDPVHEGHLYVARAAAERLRLERVLLVPAARPPHKPDRVLASGADRLALLEAAVAGDPSMEPCAVELSRPGPSYSIDTARALQERLGPEARLFFVLGADLLADLASWHRIGELARLVTFCTVTRPGLPLDPSPLLPVLGAAGVAMLREHLVVVAPHPASSTAIREALRRGESPAHLPARVLAEIDRRGLYGRGGGSSNDTSGGGTA